MFGHTRVLAYLRSLPATIQPISESSQPFISMLEKGSRWWLELLRNAMVVGAITALAERSGSLMLTIVAWMSSVALVLFSMARILNYRIDFERGESTNNFIGWISAIFTVYLSFALSISAASAFKVLFSAVAAVKS